MNYLNLILTYLIVFEVGVLVGLLIIVMILLVMRNMDIKELDYNATLPHFAHQIRIKVWQAMAMMKYAESKSMKDKQPSEYVGIGGTGGKG